MRLGVDFAGKRRFAIESDVRILEQAGTLDSSARVVVSRKGAPRAVSACRERSPSPGRLWRVIAPAGFAPIRWPSSVRGGQVAGNSSFPFIPFITSAPGPRSGCPCRGGDQCVVGRAAVVDSRVDQIDPVRGRDEDAGRCHARAVGTASDLRLDRHVAYQLLRCAARETSRPRASSLALTVTPVSSGFVRLVASASIAGGRSRR